MTRLARYDKEKEGAIDPSSKAVKKQAAAAGHVWIVKRWINLNTMKSISGLERREANFYSISMLIKYPVRLLSKHENSFGPELKRFCNGPPEDLWSSY